MVVDNYRMLEACLYRGAASEFKVRSYFYSRSKGMMSLYQECMGRECAKLQVRCIEERKRFWSVGRLSCGFGRIKS